MRILLLLIFCYLFSFSYGQRIYWTDSEKREVSSVNQSGTDKKVLQFGLEGLIDLVTIEDTQQILWNASNTSKIQVANLDGSNVYDLISQDIEFVGGLDIDKINKKIYAVSKDKVVRFNYDGSQFEEVVINLFDPTRVQVDPEHGKVYWVEDRELNLKRADIDGSNQETIFTTGSGGLDIVSFVIDHVNNKLFWYLSLVGPDAIQEANLDGSNIQNVFTDLSAPSELAIDQINGKLYWSNQLDEIWRSNLDGSTREVMSIQAEYATGIAFDHTNNKMLWINDGKKIERVNFDGSSKETIVEEFVPLRPEGLVVDTLNNKVYWANQDAIYRSDTDGSALETVVINSGSFNPTGIALDVLNNHIYFTNPGQTRIQRIDTDGGNLTDLVNGVNAFGIALDLVNNKIYWTERAQDNIKSANLDGSNIIEVLTAADGIQGVVDVKVSAVNNKIYWSDTGRDEILRADFDGSNIEKVVDVNTPWGLYVGQKLYWHNRNENKIQSADLDGANQIDILSVGLSYPEFIFVTGEAVSGASFEVMDTESNQLLMNGQSEPVSFGTVLTTSSITRPFAIINNADSEILVNKIISNTPSFVVEDVPSSIDPASTQTFNITFIEPNPGVYSGSIMIETDAGPFTFSVTGEAVIPASFTVTDAINNQLLNNGQLNAVDFGTASPGDVIVRTFEINNIGQVAITVNNIQISGSTIFSVSNEPQVVAVGGAGSFEIGAQSATAGLFSGIVIINTDEDSFTFPVQLEVKGTSNEIIVYNAVAPNGNGKHDFLRIKNIELYPNNTVAIYNRWGQKVFEISGYDNQNPSLRFEGESNISGGSKLVDGTYFYLISTDNDQMTGYLHLKK